jgi:hypothetical protein
MSGETSRRPERGHVARDERDQQQDQRHRDEGQRVSGLDLVQQALHQPRQQERCSDADGDTAHRERQPLPQDHLQHLRAVSPNRQANADFLRAL